MHLMKVHIGVSWRIRMNDPCAAAAMRPCVKLQRPLVTYLLFYWIASCLFSLARRAWLLIVSLRAIHPSHHIHPAAARYNPLTTVESCAARLGISARPGSNNAIKIIHRHIGLDAAAARAVAALITSNSSRNGAHYTRPRCASDVYLCLSLCLCVCVNKARH